MAAIEAESSITAISVVSTELTPVACFTLSEPSVALTVGPAGSPWQCRVDPAGCTFNPTIYQVASSSPVPALSYPAIALLVAFLAGLAALALPKRIA